MNDPKNAIIQTESAMETAPKDKMIIRSEHPVRSGWDKAFQEMAARGDDMLLDADQSLSSWDEEKWNW